MSGFDLSTRGLRSAWLDAVSVLAPTGCAGCGAPDRSLCERCRRGLVAEPETADVGEGRAFPVWHALRYRGVVRSVLIAFKDEGRTDVASALADTLAPTVRLALASLALRNLAPASLALASLAPASLAPANLAQAEGARLVTVPSTRSAVRRRGYRPVELVLAHAGLRASRVLRATRQTADQADLGLVERRANRIDSLRARGSLTGERFLIVDDIVTTGATLREARRALEAAGGGVLGAVTIACTERRLPRS